MKIFSIVFFLASVNAFACPNLAGNYTCKDPSGTMNMTITQTEESGVTTYHEIINNNDTAYIADGVPRPYSVQTEDGQVVDGNLSTTCADPIVKIQFLADYNGSAIDYTDTLTMVGGVLQGNSTTTSNGSVVESYDYSCTLTE